MAHEIGKARALGLPHTPVRSRKGSLGGSIGDRAVERARAGTGGSKESEARGERRRRRKNKKEGPSNARPIAALPAHLRPCDLSGTHQVGSLQLTTLL